MGHKSHLTHLKGGSEVVTIFWLEGLCRTPGAATASADFLLKNKLPLQLPRGRARLLMQVPTYPPKCGGLEELKAQHSFHLILVVPVCPWSSSCHACFFFLTACHTALQATAPDHKETALRADCTNSLQNYRRSVPAINPWFQMPPAGSASLIKPWSVLLGSGR